MNTIAYNYITQMLTVSGYTNTIKLAIQSARGWNLDEDYVILVKSARPINHLYQNMRVVTTVISTLL